MSDDLDFIVIDDIPEYTFCIPDDEELENVIPIKGEDGSFKYEKVAELPETGEDGVLYLVPKSHETQTASGNPISITVSDKAGNLDDIKLLGNATQTTYTGKNLFNVDDAVTRFENVGGTQMNDWGTYADGIVTIVKSNGAHGTCAFAGFKPTLVEGRTYTLSATIKLSGSNASNEIRFGTVPTSPKAAISGKNTWVQFSKTFTATAADVSDSRIDIQAYNTNNTIQIKNIQLEAGSSESDFEPYVGGAPVPRPDYPQDINVVTGTQTIDINGTSYPISLGNIELAKIGTYQDRIYKTDGKWYIRRDIGKKVCDGSENWVKSSSYQGNYYLAGALGTDAVAMSREYMSNLTDIFVINVSELASSDNCIYVETAGAQGRNLNFKVSSKATLQEFKDFLSATPLVFYYPLATPTTTQITDTNLINQLEAARDAALANGTNVISNTATGNNLAGDLELSYYEYDPTNRYNKWLWLDVDAAYEQM